MSFSKNVVVESGSGSYLKTPPGQTKIRIVSDAVMFYKDFDNKLQYMGKEAASKNPSAKPRYAMWVIDRGDGVIKMWECSGGMVKDIQNLAENPEYAFDGLPPYDVIINRVGTTINDTRYTVTPARTNVALTPEEQKAVDAVGSLFMELDKDAEDKGVRAPF